ncbi:helix-turn-helix transcriptional regulator [Streptantibioticus silvisoli]|uniref:helix-turn-helix transcriptional regulator n=1 Tax=Streptantibioticus silvisoli TaxID=2705255 RepID=UPI0035585E39
MKYTGEHGGDADDARQATAAARIAPAQHGAGDLAGDPAEAGDGLRGTRNKVARSILDHGPSTAVDLAERLELTPAAVRRHLDALVAEGIVEPRDRRVYGSRARGRPAKAFALTDCGRDAFYQAYDRLAEDAMRWIAESVGGGERGDAAVAAFARARVTAQLERHRERVEAADPRDRARVLAQALTEDGYAATTRDAHASSLGEQLCQHHCPVAHAAEQFPQLCEAEAEVFSHLLGTHVQRLATIAHGDGVCTTFVPRREAPPGAPPQYAPRAPRAKQQRQAKRSAGPASATTSGRNPA